MALYFTYKTPFNTLGSKFTKRIESDSILAWFQQIWQTNLSYEDLISHFVREFGTHFYGLRHLAYGIVENKTSKPESLKDLLEKLEKESYINTLRIEGDKYLEVLTDDDEFSLAWYLIEEEYANLYLNRFAYLLHEEWQLPLGTSEDRKEGIPIKAEMIIPATSGGKGELYFISVCNDGGDGPIDYSPVKIKGIRLNDLSEYLIQEKLDYSRLPLELVFYMVRFKDLDRGSTESTISQLERIKTSIQRFHRALHWYIDYNDEAIYAGYENARTEFDNMFHLLSQRTSRKDGMQIDREDIASEVTIYGNDHFIQMSIEADYWSDHPVDSGVEQSTIIDQVFIFDDLWVNENYDLACSLFKYYTSWSL